MSSNQGPDFVGAYRRAWKQNCADFAVDDVADKIKTFSEKTGIGEDAIRKKIHNDQTFRLVFVKDPKRQKIHETEAARWLQQQPAISSFRRLGSDNLVVCAGDVITKNSALAKGGSKDAQILDFKWTTRGHTVYAAHTYTLEGGGMQGKQYKDLLGFIREASKSRATRTIFIAIADGPYYGTWDRPRKATRIDALRNAANGKTVFAGRSADVPKILRDNVP